MFNFNFRRREDTIRVIVSNMNEHGVLELDELTQRKSEMNNK